MTAYNKVNGVFCSAHEYLIQDVLRKEWGWDGLTMSDWIDTNSFVPSVTAGLDLEMPGPVRRRGKHLINACNTGLLDPSFIDASASRVVELIHMVGKSTMPDWQEGPEKAVDLPEHRAILRRAGAEGIVLPKNSREILPLKSLEGKTVAVIGPNAERSVATGGGSSNLVPHHSTTPYTSIKAEIQRKYPSAEIKTHTGIITHRCFPLIEPSIMRNPNTGKSGWTLFWRNTKHEGDSFLTEHRPSSYLICYDGLPPELTRGERYSYRDRTIVTPRTTGVHQFSLSSCGPGKLILDGQVLINIERHWWSAKPPLFMSYGSPEERVNVHMEAGRADELVLESLPMTFPRRMEDTPAFDSFPGENDVTYYGEGIYLGYRYYDHRKIEPLFPFGAGLSYTTFEYSDINLSGEILEGNSSIEVEVNMKNAGRRDGKEVVQFYMTQANPRLARPPRGVEGKNLSVAELEGTLKSTDERLQILTDLVRQGQPTGPRAEASSPAQNQTHSLTPRSALVEEAYAAAASPHRHLDTGRVREELALTQRHSVAPQYLLTWPCSALALTETQLQYPTDLEIRASVPTSLHGASAGSDVDLGFFNIAREKFSHQEAADWLSVQCLLLMGMFYSAKLRVYDAWHVTHRACCTILILAPLQTTLDAHQCQLFWIAYLQESQILAEFGFPSSGLGKLANSIPLPVVPNAAMDPQLAQYQFFFLALIAVRKLLDRILLYLYNRGKLITEHQPEDASTAGSPSADAPTLFLLTSHSMITELDRQLEEWRGCLPPSLNFASYAPFEERVPPEPHRPRTTEERLRGFLMARYFAAKSIIYRPYIYRALYIDSPSQLSKDDKAGARTAVGAAFMNSVSSGLLYEPLPLLFHPINVWRSFFALGVQVAFVANSGLASFALPKQWKMVELMRQRGAAAGSALSPTVARDDEILGILS
ncbi:hypothetical protein ACHAQH_004311 [Verticillium albo-atrum]